MSDAVVIPLCATPVQFAVNPVSNVLAIKVEIIPRSPTAEGDKPSKRKPDKHVDSGH
jgi:hypothetical protein